MQLLIFGFYFCRATSLSHPVGVEEGPEGHHPVAVARSHSVGPRKRSRPEAGGHRREDGEHRGQDGNGNHAKAVSSSSSTPGRSNLDVAENVKAGAAQTLDAEVPGVRLHAASKLGPGCIWGQGSGN